MAIYVTKKCPNCGYAYQVHQSGDQRSYGSPYRTCVNCHNSYWDKDIKEPALYGYSNAHEYAQGAKNILATLIYIPIAIFSFYEGISLLTYGSMIGLAAIGFGCLVSFFIISAFIGAYKNSKDTQIILEQRREYDESLKRLKNTEYLSALAQIDSKAKKLLQDRINGQEETYAERP